MISENAYSVLREDIQQYNNQFIQITKISPLQISTRLGSRERYNLQNGHNYDNQNINNTKELNDISPQSSNNLIAEQFNQFQKMQENNQKDQKYQINLNGKYNPFDLDKNMKLFTNEKSPINKQMLITRFIERNQKELNQNYENIEDDLRKPIGMRTFHNDETDINDQDLQIDSTQSNNCVFQKKSDSKNNTATNFNKNLSQNNKTQQSRLNTISNPSENQIDSHSQQNGRRTTEPISQNKKTEESDANKTTQVSSNTIYNWNVYNRIILKQTERKRIKLQRIGQVNSNINNVVKNLNKSANIMNNSVNNMNTIGNNMNNSVNNMNNSVNNMNNSVHNMNKYRNKNTNNIQNKIKDSLTTENRQKEKLIKQRSQKESPFTTKNSFYNPESNIKNETPFRLTPQNKFENNLKNKIKLEKKYSFEQQNKADKRIKTEYKNEIENKIKTEIKVDNENKNDVDFLDQSENLITFNNSRSNSFINPNKTFSHHFYQIDEQNYSCCPNKQISQRNSRPQTQQNRRRIYSSQQKHHIQQNKQQNNQLNETNISSNNILRVFSPFQENRNDSFLFTDSFKNPASANNASQNKDSVQNQTQYSTLFKISSYNVKPNNCKAETSCDQIQKQNESIIGMNIHRKRKSTLKQMSDYKQKMKKEKEINQLELKSRKNAKQNENIFILEAAGFNSAKPPLFKKQIQNVSINNNQEFFSQMTALNDRQNAQNNIIEHEYDINLHNISLIENNDINLNTEKLNKSFTDIDQKKCNITGKYKTKSIDNISINQQYLTLQNQSPHLQSSKNEKQINQFASLNQNITTKEDTSTIQLNKSKQNISKYELIKQQIENEKKRKKMQEQMEEQEIEKQRAIKKQQLQDLYTMFLNQQTFNQQLRNRDSTKSPSRSPIHQKEHQISPTQAKLLHIESSPLPQNISFIPQASSIGSKIKNQQYIKAFQESPQIKEIQKYNENKIFLQVHKNPQESISNEIFQNQTFGLYDQNKQNSQKNSLNNTLKAKKKVKQNKEKGYEMGPWTSQREEDLEEQYPINNNKNNI